MSSNSSSHFDLTVKLSKDEAIGITWAIMNGPMFIEFSTFHGIAEFAFGRPVWTHEFPQLLPEINKMWKELLERKTGRNDGSGSG